MLSFKYLLFIPLVIFQLIQLSASPFEVKIEYSNIECNLENSIVYFNILIKKKDSEPNAIYLKNQNYRLEFNAQTLEENSFFIESEGDLLSSFNINDDGSVYIFATHTLNGTSLNIVSYNIDFTGGTGFFELPSDDWTTVGTIGATLKTNIECVSTNILTSPLFPPTILIYDTDLTQNNLDETPAIISNWDACVESYCNLCSPHLILSQNQNDYISGEILEHKVSDYINASNTISNQSNIIYNITNEALLEPGFEVLPNSDFEIKIDGCIE